MEAILDLAALLLGLSALFGYLNHKVVRLPHTIGLLVMALAASLVVLAIDALIPEWGLKITASALVSEVEFTETLMEGMLSFLLFAGALHVDLEDMLDRRWAIGLMATFGVLLSTFAVGTGLWAIFDAIGVAIPWIVCLVIGAVISPTDPVAVLGLLKTARVPRSLEAKIAGESLFNDGVGVVVFTIVAAIAFGGAEHATGPGDVVLLFVQEALGGALLGLVTGYVTFLAMRSIDEHNVEVLISLALVTVTYGIASELHVSGPIAVVVAGLLIGNHGTRLAMSKNTREHLVQFWTLIDEMLNSVLFLLIGFEVFAISGRPEVLVAALATIPLALAARLLAVSAPVGTLSLFRDYTRGAVWVLTWGGLRGGISVALALSLPPSEYTDALVTVVYVVVVFSVVVQGLTVSNLIRRVVPTERTMDGG